jgi:4-aminobutyrate---pyruvate transaminase
VSAPPPGGRSAAAERDVASLLHPGTNIRRHEREGPTIVVRGDGARVYDEAGREYIEAVAGAWNVSLGFGEPELVRVACQQLETLPYYHAIAHKSTLPMIDLAAKLKELAPVPIARVFFTTSGSEANDTQIKLLWAYENVAGRPRKKKLISRRNAFHGVTVAAGSLTGLDVNQRGFDLPLDFVRFVRCPDHWRDAEPGETEREYSQRLADELEDLIVAEDPETVAGFIAEPVMGAGGVYPPPDGYFDAVQQVLDRHDVRLIADEVVTGFGRTGWMWGSEAVGMRPHTISCAKALSSGYLPIGAVLIDEPMYDALRELTDAVGKLGHGFTYGGHPAAAAVALKTIELVERRGLVERTARMGERLAARLDEIRDRPVVGHVRQAGLMAGVELSPDTSGRTRFAPEAHVGEVCQRRCLERGLIVRAIGDVIALCPPLAIGEEEIDLMVARLSDALDDTAARVRREPPGRLTRAVH